MIPESERNVLLRKLPPDRPPKVDIAALLIEGMAGNTMAMRQWAGHILPAEQIELTTLHETMEDAGWAARRNELGQAEAMLPAQAVTLNTLFTALAARAAGNRDLEVFQVNLRMALRAQANCVRTLEVRRQAVVRIDDAP